MLLSKKNEFPIVVKSIARNSGTLTVQYTEQDFNEFYQRIVSDDHFVEKLRRYNLERSRAVKRGDLSSPKFTYGMAQFYEKLQKTPEVCGMLFPHIFGRVLRRMEADGFFDTASDELGEADND